MLFDWLLHSKTRLRMLKLFFRDTSRCLYGLEISQKLNASPGTTHRELNAMIKKGVLKKKKQGALMMYSLNFDFPNFLDLQQAVKPSGKKSNIIIVSDILLSDSLNLTLSSELQLLINHASQNADELVFLGNTFNLLEGNPFNTYLLHQPIISQIIQLAQRVKTTIIPGTHDILLAAAGFSPTFKGEMSRERQRGSEGCLFGTKVLVKQEYHQSKLGISGQFGAPFSSSKKVKSAPQPGFSNGRQLFQSLRSLESSEPEAPVADYYASLKKVAALSHHYRNLSYARQPKDSKAIEKSLVEKAKVLLKSKEVSYVVNGYSQLPEIKSFKNGHYLNPGSFKTSSSFLEINQDGGEVKHIDDLK